jgi:uncharacterized membrane protein
MSHKKKPLIFEVSQNNFEDLVMHNSSHLPVLIEFMKSLFQETIDRIIGLIKSALTNTNARGISTILLVGGFSECHLLSNIGLIHRPYVLRTHLESIQFGI